MPSCPSRASTARFYGWRVVYAAFLLGVFGWGLGFYGPPVFLSVILKTHAWPVVTVSGAISVHFFAGALIGANLPVLYSRFGAPRVTQAGAVCMALGLLGWANTAAAWQLFPAALLTGTGWGTMSAAALNAIVSPWFDRARPAALGMAYNGGSVGGIIFSPLWVALIAALGFAGAASVVACIMLVTLWMLARHVFSRTPANMKLAPDGDAPGAPATATASPAAHPLPGMRLWSDRRFLTLCAGMTLGLFAQIGLIAHLYSLLAPVLGDTQAGLAMALITVMAIAGRALTGWLMPARANRRHVACMGYGAQAAGSLLFYLAAGANMPLLLAGVVLFGVGFGNATSLPPLIAQKEFAKQDVVRVAALIVGIAQGGYAIAPAIFGLLRSFTPSTAGTGEAPWLFLAAAGIQALAVAALVAGQVRKRER
jgi:MFS family permease